MQPHFVLPRVVRSVVPPGVGLLDGILGRRSRGVVPFRSHCNRFGAPNERDPQEEGGHSRENAAERQRSNVVASWRHRIIPTGTLHWSGLLTAR
jgi:hypothetical protein